MQLIRHPMVARDLTAFAEQIVGVTGSDIGATERRLAKIEAIAPAVARRIMEHFQLIGPAALPDDSQTKREKEVLALISRGMHNVDVSEQLLLSGNTVATHIKSIYRKLGISSHAEASCYATMLGLTPGRTEAGTPGPLPDRMPSGDCDIMA